MLVGMNLAEGIDERMYVVHTGDMNTTSSDLSRCECGQWHGFKHPTYPGDRRPPKRARSVKVSDDLWLAAQATAEQRGEVVSEVIRAALERYVKRS